VSGPAETTPPPALYEETPVTPPVQPPVFEAKGANIQPSTLQSTLSEIVPPSELIGSQAAENSWEWNADQPPTVPVVAFPRYGELSPLTLPAKFQKAGRETTPQITTPPNEGESVVPSNAYREPPSAIARIAEGETMEGHWPELPRSDEPEEVDESSLMRARKHQDRLYREQRGMGWSEPLS
jgi:hypothetical protein